MSYIGRYERFIDALKNQSVNGLVEMHHIVPKSMGGSNKKSNLIALTPRQHYIAHWMLWKAYGNKMAQAFWFMNNNGKHKAISSRSYEKLVKDARKAMSGENASWYGKKATKEMRAKQSEKRKAYMANPEARENVRKHRASQIIPSEAYERQAKVMSSLIWMNDGNRSYRVKPELVNEKLDEGLMHGRIMSHINDEYKKLRSEIATKQWNALKSSGHVGSLKRISL